MSKFFVGQRVRIIGCFPGSRAKKFIGRETAITATGHNALGDRLYAVAIDDGSWGFSSDQLSPIQPQGAAPSEYTYTELMDRLKAGEVERV